MRRRESHEPPAVEPGDATGSMGDVTRRIQEIINDADRKAGQIIVNAEVEARKYAASVKQQTDQEALEYARAMRELSEALISHAEMLNQESERLLQNIDQFEGDDPSEFEDGIEAEDFGASEFEPRRFAGAGGEPRDEDEFVDPRERYSAGARLLATQMAVAGSTRADIRDRLVNDFGIGDPDPLLDSIMGPG